MRAVYSKARLLILDDVLSSQDAITQERLTGRLLGPQGLLRKSGITVIFATLAGGLTPFTNFKVNPVGLKQHQSTFLL